MLYNPTPETMPVLPSFLHPDNQTMLWSIISQHPLFDQVLTEPERWFQSILEHFFMECQQQQQQQQDVVEIDETLYNRLKTLNQKTLLYMVQDLQQRATSMARNQVLVKPTSLSGMVETETQMKFSVEKDEPIRNLEERIMEQQQFRENQDYIFPPLPKEKPA